MESDSSKEQNEIIVTKIMKLKYDLTYDAFREVTFQEHKSEKPCPEKPLKRTLFLSKVPPWANESGLQRIFACNGPVQKVFLAKKASSGLTDEDSRDYSGVDRFLFPTKDTSGFKFAYVVYERPSSVTKALHTMDLSHPYILSDEENPIVTGNSYCK
jgi:RNA recognition motif-containing protein